jgi:hypothetical protein
LRLFPYVNRINTSVAHPLDNTNTEIAVAQYEDGLIGLAKELAKYTENQECRPL